MVCMHHGGLPTAALLGRSPHSYTSVTGDLNLLQKICSKSVVHNPDPNKDTLKRHITTVPPSITTTHHDGGLPSPLSYSLAADNPPLPSRPTQRLRQNLSTGAYSKTTGGQNGRLCSLQMNWKQNKLWRRLIGSAGRN
jgi:hypothetical protein